jgi:2-polyprenyl-3-methyl-5-hydroxy-6-metoxy-1,4-benzoquinol methylase
LPKLDSGTMLDCGCADGSLSLRFAEQAGCTTVLGIEAMPSLAQKARDRGLRVVGSDLNEPFALPDHSVEVATANQVIEHVANTDQFVEELRRVLKPSGKLVISTNNLASWHNIAPLLLGAQPFAADVSNDASVGKIANLYEDNSPDHKWGTWTHLRIFSHRALTEMMERHGFAVDTLVGVGYYPLSGRWAERMATIDPRHAAYITVACTRVGS